MSVSVVRPKCLENLKEGLLPQKWMGQKIKAINSTAGCDVDFDWQVPSVEYWIKNIKNKKLRLCLQQKNTKNLIVLKNSFQNNLM